MKFMKVCVIGNSHVAAIKTGFDALVSHKKKSLTVDFYAARGSSLKDLDLNGVDLVPNTTRLRNALEFTSGGSASIHLKGYDTFLLYGLHLEPFFFLNDFYSDAVLKSVVVERFENTISTSLINKIRQVSSSPIYLGHDPLPAENTTDKNEKLINNFLFYKKGIDFSNEVYFSGYNAELLIQPKETIALSGNQTLFDFSVGSRRLDVGLSDEGQLHDFSDNYHMNDKFGKIWMEQFLDKI